MADRLVTMGAQATRPFVGRESEAAALARHWAAAADGAGRVVLVTGDAGIGKTRVVEEVVGAPGSPGVAWGRCREDGGAPAFWPWVEALRPRVRALDSERLRAAAGFSAGELARLFPELATHLGLQAQASDATPGSPTARFRLFDAFVGLLDALSAEPLAIVLDDLHWADGESLLLLRFLGPEVRSRPLLIVATCRENELRAVPEAPHIQADLARLAERVPLTGLTVDAVAAYARATSGIEPSPGVVRAIHAATAGNSFFVTEVVALLARAGRLDWPELRIDDLQLPAGLRDAVLRRLDALPPETRALLRLAAVAGPSIDLAVLAHAAGTDVRDALARLAPAFAFGVLEDAAPASGTTRFAHQLVADALCDELAPDVRRELHLALADALEDVRAAALDEVAADLARHLQRAAPLADPARTVAALARAGDRALDALGYEDAAAHFAQAVEVARASGGAPGLRLDLQTRLAEALLAAGDDEGARASALEAARQARAVGDPARLVAATALAGAARSETGHPDHELIALLEDAERAAADDDELRARVLSPLSRELYFTDRARRLATSDEALRLARRLDDPALLAAALGARHLALWEPGRAAERLALAEEQLVLAERAHDAQVAMHAHAWRIADLLELGRTDAADEALRRYEALAARLRLPRLSWHVAVAHASRALRLGRLAEAERRANEALATWKAGPQNNVLQFHAIQLFVLREEQGRLVELDEALQAFAAGSALPAWQAALASLHATLGRTDEARRLLRELAARVDELPLDGTWISTLARLAQVAAAVGDADVAQRLLPLLAPHAGTHVVLGAGVAWLGPVSGPVGLLALAAGRTGEAIAHLEDALAASRACRSPNQIAHAQAALAAAYRARGDAGDARRADEAFAEAAAIADEIGLGGLASELAREPDQAARAGALRGATRDAAREAATDDDAASVAVLRRDGDGWLVAHRDETVRLRDMKGVHYLRTLLREPGRELHALDVVGSDVAPDPDAGELADPEARRAYRERLTDLRAELDEAEERHDVGRAERLRAEIERMAEELVRFAGVGRGARRAGSMAERARLNATRAIRKVIDRIAESCPRLGHHLSHSVETGRICSYREDPTYPVRWQLDDRCGSA